MLIIIASYKKYKMINIYFGKNKYVHSLSRKVYNHIYLKIKRFVYYRVFSYIHYSKILL